MALNQNDSAADDQIPLWIRSPSGIAFSEIPTRSNGRLPSFLVIGAAKGGTSSVNRYLDQHSKIHMCPQKEPHFFSTDMIFDRGLPWYKGLFYEATEGQICGEASTSYTFSQCSSISAKRIFEFIPQCKLIYIVREPVSRVESEALQGLKYRRSVLKEISLPNSVDELVKNNPDSVCTSEYITQIDRYLEYFKEDQLLILLQEDLRKNPAHTLKTVLNFLNVDANETLRTNESYNVTKDFKDDLKIVKATDHLRNLPGYETIKEIMPKWMKRKIKASYGSSILSKDVIKPMSNETRSMLKEHFEPFNKRLSVFLNRDLSHWNLA